MCIRDRLEKARQLSPQGVIGVNIMVALNNYAEMVQAAVQGKDVYKRQVLALFHRPKLLIFDEPTSGLDPLMQRRFFEVLEQVNAQGTTIFFSSHVLSEVQRLCHRVGIIKEGRILQVGKMDDLRHKYFRNVRVEFKEGLAPKIDLPGILHSHQENGALNMLYNGDINQLLAVLAQQELANLWLEEPSLEEIFLHLSLIHI